MRVDRETDLPAEAVLGDGTQIKLWMHVRLLHGKLHRKLCCGATIERDPPRRVKETLVALTNRRLVLDDPPQLDLPPPWGIDTDGHIKSGITLNLSVMPRHHQVFQRDLGAELAAVIRQFIATIRWRQRATGSRQPHSLMTFEWSNDSESWHRLPPDTSTCRVYVKNLDLQRSMLAEIADMIPESMEPFAHELIREAMDLRQSAPRSALLIAMSALETGLKHYIIHLVPDADLLVMKMPSPPLLSLLQEVIPTVHKNRGIESTHIPLREEAKRFLQKWITQRNQLAHGSKKSVNADALVEFIVFATDLLYILDYHRGHAWALEQLASSRVARDAATHR